MYEIIANLHMHTVYSDGHATHAEIAEAALKAGIDVVIITDHTVWVNGIAGYCNNGNRRVLMLVGEEIHDQSRQPQKNHLLVFGANRELAELAPYTQRLLDTADQAGGLTFIAHPVDPAAPAFGEPDLSWVDWEVQNYTGIELWNAMSEFKSLLKSKAQAIYYAFNPKQVGRGPFKESLAIWDDLLSNGRKVVAVGGSDAHALPARLGPLHRTLFPYEFHFRADNTHLLLSSPLTGNFNEDRRKVFDALRAGHAFIGYDLPAPTRGFNFTAQGKHQVACMGDEIQVQTGVTLQVRLPGRVECRMIKDGKPVKTWSNRENCTYITTEPGVYRVEAYIRYLGRRGGWIFSNPIYVRS